LLPPLHFLFLGVERSFAHDVVENFANSRKGWDGITPAINPAMLMAINSG
jgi:hypothetical protein